MRAPSTFAGLPTACWDIAMGVAAGETNAAIAKKTHLSPSTVAAYLSRMYEQAGCPNRTALAAQIGTIVSKNQEYPSHA
jgi:DNA-binding NarL/FixJ family response regulator